jgi:hypothetical protein
MPDPRYKILIHRLEACATEDGEVQTAPECATKGSSEWHRLPACESVEVTRAFFTYEMSAAVKLRKQPIS